MSNEENLHKLPRPKWSLRSGVVFILKFLISAGLIILCSLYVDPSSVVAAFAGVDPLVILLAFAIATLGTIVLPSIVTKTALSINRIYLSLPELIQINFAVRFYVIVLPRAISMWIRWLRYRKGGTGSDALALLAFERATQMAIIFAMTLIAAALELPQLGNWGGAILMVSTIGAAASLTILALFLSPWTATKAKALSDAANRVLPGFLALKLHRLVSAVTAFQKLPKQTTFSILIITLFGFVCFVLSAFVLAKALGLDLSFVALVWVRGLVFAMTLVPITVAGVGVREIGFIGLLGLYGVSAPDAMSFSLANFGVQLAIAAVGAVLEIGRLLRGAMRRSGSAFGTTEERR